MDRGVSRETLFSPPLAHDSPHDVKFPVFHVKHCLRQSISQPGRSYSTIEAPSPAVIAGGRWWSQTNQYYQRRTRNHSPVGAISPNTPVRGVSRETYLFTRCAHRSAQQEVSGRSGSGTNDVAFDQATSSWQPTLRDVATPSGLTVPSVFGQQKTNVSRETSK